jgi:hypothetical protein
MKSRTPLLAVVAAGSLMFAGVLLAQDQTVPAPPPPPQPAQSMPAQQSMPPQPMPTPPQPTATQAPPPPPTQTMPATQPTPPPPPGGTQAQTGVGGQQVTINSSVPPVNAGPAPSFEQLANGKKYISESDASAYPLLANDWSYVDKGHSGHVTRAQYEAWVNNNK